MSSMNGVFSDSWPGSLRWKRNCTLLPWFWKGACRFFSPASRSICPAQVGQRHLNHDKRRPQNSWRIQIKSQCSHTNKVWFCCLSNTPENAVLLCRKTWSNILWVKASEVALKTTFLSTVFKTLCESIQFKESLDLLWTSKKKLCLFLSAFHI